MIPEADSREVDRLLQLHEYLDGELLAEVEAFSVELENADRPKVEALVDEWRKGDVRKEMAAFVRRYVKFRRGAPVEAP